MHYLKQLLLSPFREAFMMNEKYVEIVPDVKLCWYMYV
jgi:hypothetical protein